jgi:hypothetical protein
MLVIDVASANLMARIRTLPGRNVGDHITPIMLLMRLCGTGLLNGVLLTGLVRAGRHIISRLVILRDIRPNVGGRQSSS